MTTIFYHQESQTIAVDGRVTSSGLVVSDSDQKWHLEESGDIWFLSGCISDYDLLFSAFKESDRAFDLPAIPDAVAIFVRRGEVFLRGVTDKGEAWTQKLTHSRAIGSGASFALAAFDFGRSAKEAVQYAATRDIYTGGKVHVYDIGTGEFIE